MEKQIKIAITGKGGVGKTTLAALLIRQLIQRNCRPVLAVDADPNACLNLALGVPLIKTIGGVREEAREIVGKGLATGMAKQELLEIKVGESLVEADDFDLIAMGRPEGPGCYCYANNVLKTVLAEIAGNYPYVVIDNEAGLENLSRRIVQQVDLLIIIADPSHQGLETIRRIYDLAGEMQIQFKQLAIVINRMRRTRDTDEFDHLKFYTKADWMLFLPEDEEIALLSENGSSLLNLSLNNKVVQQIDFFLADLK